MIVRLGNDQTLLITHNIDLAPRVPNPIKGKILRFYGEYEWNDEGGVIHWTHTDPDGEHIDGWLEYEGIRYGGDISAITRIFDVRPAKPRSFPGGTVRHDNYASLNTTGLLFDIQGRFLGHALIRWASGMYLIRYGNKQQEILKYFH